MMRLLFEGGFYSRVAFIGEFTVYIATAGQYIPDHQFQRANF